ncbi:hypothetical protein CWB99_00025 [Pseudoalteromonas rubra]|uniref:Uncharacterized protein n=1 Tax=Pseudoalteromonas rubra TaxID=43658 RepID=A0A5S3WUH1_9GAMM|nr:hypothetical protein CWC00_14610 [Pseudoalteromonas rubra]TMP33076.1 hypothetical protein CWB99_00025 [Pseudoalteromonas rubra]
MTIPLTDYLYHLSFIIMIAALIRTWKYECSRYFLLFMLVLEAIDEAILHITITWTTHYYLYCIIFDLVFCIPIIYRKHIAQWVYNLTGWDFFRRVYNNHHLALQEIGFLFIFFVDIVLNIIIYAEVWLYKWWIIDNLYLKDYFRPVVLLFIYFFTCCALATYTVKAKAREEFYRTHKTPESSTI